MTQLIWTELSMTQNQFSALRVELIGASEKKVLYSPKKGQMYYYSKDDLNIFL